MSFVGPASLPRFSRRLFGCSSTAHHTYRLSSPSFRRSYAWSRNPDTTRNRFGSATSIAKQAQRKQRLTAPDEPVWRAAEYGRDTVSSPGGDSSAEDGLEQLLQNDTIVVVRQLEMMNIFLGFEQANRYALLDPLGNPVGYMAEEERGFLATLQRQLFRTHRPFRSTILDLDGNIILKVYRPFAWINSRTFVQRHVLDDAEKGKETVVGEVQQMWHLWRRRYNLFSGRNDLFTQFAAVDAPFLSWDFFLQDEAGNNLASVVRNFTGFGRELFTDTGQYVLSFRPDPGAPSALPQPSLPIIYRPLSLEERATVLALSTTLDIDFFSRHSESGSMRIPWWLLFGGSEE